MQDPANPNRFLNEEPQFYYTLFLPSAHNKDGCQLVQLFDWLACELVKVVGGFTRYHPGVGLWISPTGIVLSRDALLPFHFVAKVSPELERQLLQLIADLALRFKLEKVFLFAQPVWVVRSSADEEDCHYPSVQIDLA